MTADPRGAGKKPRFPIRLAGLGIELAAAVVGLTLVGIWIDRRFESAPWGVVIGASIGLVGGFYNFVRAAIRAAGESARDGKRGDEAQDG